MTATLIRPLAESRPPGLTWSAPFFTQHSGGRSPVAPTQSAQPTLDLVEPVPPQPGPDQTVAVVLRSRWCARVRPDLPDARRWSTALALALVETLHALRPVQQLTRWLDDDVMDAVTLHVRRRRATAPVVLGRPPAAPPAIRSVRIQHPDPEVAEVSVHLGTTRRSAALAFRLEASGQRWLCTALELGPRVTSG